MPLCNRSKKDPFVPSTVSTPYCKVPSQRFSFNPFMLYTPLACVGSIFTAVDLAKFARDLDEEERQRMAEGDVNSEEYQRFLKVESK